MPTILSSIMSRAEIKELGDKMFTEITAVYSLLSLEQLAAVQADTLVPVDDSQAQADRITLRGLLSYTQARYCRLNFITPEELSQGQFLFMEEARRACSVFSSVPDDRRLMDECIEMNLLPIYTSARGVVVRRAEFQAWHDGMEAKLRASRPECIDYGFHWVRDEAA